MSWEGLADVSDFAKAAAKGPCDLRLRGALGCGFRAVQRLGEVIGNLRSLEV